MGMYDSVMVACPKCGESTEFQSKGGEGLLRVYELAAAPADVLSDVNRHGPATCELCGTRYTVCVPHRDEPPLAAELAAAVRQTLEENGHLADGDVCTLRVLRDAYEKYMRHAGASPYAVVVVDEGIGYSFYTDRTGRKG